MKPSDFMINPFSSVLKKSEAETIARNIMVILSRTGNEWRLLSWNEYKSERLKDGSFTESEKPYFEQVVNYCQLEETARLFSPTWNEIVG